MRKAAVARGGPGRGLGQGWLLFAEGPAGSGQPGKEHRAGLGRDSRCPGALSADSCPEAGAWAHSDLNSAPGVSPEAVVPSGEGETGEGSHRLLLVTCAPGGLF